MPELVTEPIGQCEATYLILGFDQRNVIDIKSDMEQV